MQMGADIREKLMQIKQSFRLRMDGMVSKSMREKGMEYKINWGIPFYELKKMAQSYGRDYQLAVELWKEDIRECKILATLIMPPEKMDEELVEVWMSQTVSQEMAEMLAFNLYQHLDYAQALAYKWMASNDVGLQICAYQLMARLFMKGQEPNERGINEFLDQACVALCSDNLGVKHAATNCLWKFAGLGDEYEKLMHGYLKARNLDPGFS